MGAELFLPLLVIAVIGTACFFFKSRGKKTDISGTEAALQARLRLTGIFILIPGLFAALLVYLRTAPGDEGEASVYVTENGSSYTVMPSDSKKYEYQMEVIGGASNVLAAEITDWIRSLWHGRKLAYTLTFLSLGGSLGCFFLAHLQTHPLRRTT